MNVQKNNVPDSPTGLSDSWKKFPWGKYPGGVTVHFALTSGGKLYLHRRGYGYWVCEQVLRQGETLAHTVTRLYQHLAADKINLQTVLTPEVCAVRHEPATLRILVQIECLPVASRLKLEPFAHGLVLGALLGDHPMSQELHSLLGFSTQPSKTEELPQAA
jgi:hypothetical protein